MIEPVNGDKVYEPAPAERRPFVPFRLEVRIVKVDGTGPQDLPAGDEEVLFELTTREDSRADCLRRALDVLGSIGR